VHCARYGDDVGADAVRELIGALTNAQATRGFLVATSGFTREAQREADNAPYYIALVGDSTFVSWSGRYGLRGAATDGGWGSHPKKGTVCSDDSLLWGWLDRQDVGKRDAADR